MMLLKNTRRLIWLIILTILFFLPAADQLAQETGAGPRAEPHYTFNPVIVTANRFATPFDDVARHVTVLTRADIQQAAAQNLPDLLAFVGGLDVQRRGPLGIQADVAMRGASFEGTLLLLDGLRLNDPQTAHHNLNLPVPLENIERIEILHGSGSALYGADAVGGVINIITREAAPRLFAQATAGDYGLYNLAGGLGFKTGGLAHNLSANVARTDGFTDYTASELASASYKSRLVIGATGLEFFAGYNEKKFHANSFYSSAFPNEWEHTRALLGTMAAHYSRGAFEIKPRFAWKQHNDDFILDYARPDWYRNRHTTTTTSVEAPLSLHSGLGKFMFSGEMRREEITSSSLGDHARIIAGFNAAVQTTWRQKLVLHLAAHYHYYDRWGWQFWPQVDVVFKPILDWQVYATATTSFRMPSYTDLYYVSPANLGNPNLMYEESRTIEGGTRLVKNGIMASAAVFYRRGQNLIDWVRQSAADPWQVQNITELNTAGLETTVSIHPARLAWLKEVGLAYTMLSADRAASPLASRYVLNYLQHQANLSLTQALPFAATLNWQLCWRQRVFSNGYLLADARVARSFGAWSFFISAANMLNTAYNEIAGVPAPGRWLSAGVSGEW